MVKVSIFWSGLLTAMVSALTVSAKPAASGLLLPQFLLDPSGGLALTGPDVFANVSEPCVDEFQRIKTEYRNQTAKELAFMLLASGKNFPVDAGRYALCTHHSSTPNGRYFLVTTALEGGPTVVPGFSGTVDPELGLCLPNKCSSEDIFQVVNNSAQQLLDYSLPYYPDAASIKFYVTKVTSPELDIVPPGAAFYSSVSVLMLLVLLVVVTTAMEHLLSGGDDGESKPEDGNVPLLRKVNDIEGGERGSAVAQNSVSTADLPFIVSVFSAKTNIAKLCKHDATSETAALNGMRVLSMAWIILGHTFLMPQAIAGYDNPDEVVGNYGAQNSYSIQLILGAEIGVDSFFFLSGFLLSHLTLAKLAKPGAKAFGVIQWVQAMVYRYLRLTPSFAFAMLVYWGITFNLSSGPFAANFQHSITRRCVNSWWSELLYLMNFVPYDPDSVCMGWTWYLGNDFIFAAIALIIIPIYCKSRVAGWGMAVIIFAASCAVTMYAVVKDNLGIYVFDAHYRAYSNEAYSRPWNRIPAYLVGVCAAWILADARASGAAERFWKSFCWTSFYTAFALAVMLFTVFAPETDFAPTTNSWGPLANGLYLVFIRPAWAAAMAAITVVCIGNANPLKEVNSFLSRSEWTALARLTYGAYLVHPIIIKMLAGNMTTKYHYNLFDTLNRWCFNVVAAYTCSFCLFLLVERPCMSLTSRALRGK